MTTYIDAKISLRKDICVDFEFDRCTDVASPTECWARMPCRGLCPMLFHIDNHLDRRNDETPASS